MSEYQYYEFLAIDKPLGAAAMNELRQISSRASISQGRMAVTYNWGDFKGDPAKLMQKHFDLFVYVANWGTHRFALRLPKQLVDETILDRYALEDEVLSVHRVGENIILDMMYDSGGDDNPFGYEEDGENWMSRLSSLRSDLLGGDMSLFALLWLIQVDRGWIRDETPMPQQGITKLSAPLYALADFLLLDRNLLEAAAPAENKSSDEPSSREIDAFLRALPNDEKLDLLKKLYDGDDPHLGASLRHRHRASLKEPVKTPTLTASELRKKSKEIAEEKARLEKQRKEQARRERERKEAQAKAERLALLSKRGESVWKEIDDSAELRNAQGYDKAAALVADLAEIASQNSNAGAFAKKLAVLRDKHASKRKFIERLDKISLSKTVI